MRREEEKVGMRYGKEASIIAIKASPPLSLTTTNGMGGKGGGKREMASQKKMMMVVVALPNHQPWHVKWKPSRNMYTLLAHFLHVPALICMLSRCLSAKSLHRSSVGSLSRVRCWLGTVDSWFSAEGEKKVLKVYSQCSKRFCNILLAEEVVGRVR